MPEPTRIVAVNERGDRVGEDHPRAKLTNHEVELIRELYEFGGITMRQIAEKFEVAPATICGIVNYRQRATIPAGWRRVGPAPSRR